MTVHLPNTQIKTCFHVLWFNYELKIETGNEKHKMPHRFRTLAEHFKTKYRVFFSFLKRGKDLCHYTRGVQCKSTRGVQYKNTRGVQRKNTRGVHLLNINWRCLFMYCVICLL